MIMFLVKPMDTKYKTLLLYLVFAIYIYLVYILLLYCNWCFFLLVLSVRNADNRLYKMSNLTLLDNWVWSFI